jgi:hypothetical protein
MSVGLALVDRPDRSADPLCVRLDKMLAELAEAVAACAQLRDVGAVSDAERIDRIARLEQLKAAAAALQAAESVRFAQSQVAQQIAADVHPRAFLWSGAGRSGASPGGTAACADIMTVLSGYLPVDQGGGLPSSRRPRQFLSNGWGQYRRL